MIFNRGEVVGPGGVWKKEHLIPTGRTREGLTKKVGCGLDMGEVILGGRNKKSQSEKTQKVPAMQLVFAGMFMLNEGVYWEVKLGE